MAATRGARQAPHTLQRLVPRSLRERRIDLVHALEAFTSSPGGEAVHDLRVALRRAEAAARLFKGFPAKGQGREARRMARSLRKSLSTHRQREVSLTLIQSLKGADPTAVESLARLPHWASPDPKALVAFGRQLASLLQRWARAVKAQPTSDAIESALSKAVTRRLRKARREVLRYAVPSRRTLHRQRIAGKALRYELELLETVDPSASALVKASRRFQEALGEAHDWSEARNDLEAWREVLSPERLRTAKAFLFRLDTERLRSFRKARQEAETYVKLLRRARFGR